MIVLDFEAVELAEQMLHMSKELGLAAPQIVKVEALQLLKQVIKETSPDNKSQGRKAVLRDITRAITPLDPARFTSPSISQAIRANDVPALNAIMLNARNKWRNWKVVDSFDPVSQHKQVRDRRGRVQRFKKKFTANFRKWKTYARQMQSEVGAAKSSWALGYREVGGSLPEWIAGHDASGFSMVVSNIHDSEKPFITVTSSAHGVVDDPELRRSIKRAMEIRTRAMEGKTRRMLSDPLKYAKLWSQYR